MKKNVRLQLVLVLVCSIILSLVACGNAEKPEILDIGIPYSEQYPNDSSGSRSRIPWDVKLYNKKLYVSAGNYNDNTGPIELRWYDTTTGNWERGEQWIYEEQIHAFCEINGFLTIPGSDSCLNSGYANYYQLKEGEWEQYAAFPNARHNFDILQFEDKIFAAVGADPGFSPILISNDNGLSFEQVPLSLNGNVVNTALYDMVRCYFLFEHENEVYALVLLKIEGKGKTHVIAKYDSGKQEFLIFNDFNSITPTGTAIGMTHTFFTEAVTWRGQVYFTNGKLIRFMDDKLQLTGILDDSIVWDILVYEDRLYVLAGKEGESGVITTVYYTDDGKKFTRLLDFQSSLRAVSFEIDEKNVYFGMVAPSPSQEDKTGSVFMVQYNK